MQAIAEKDVEIAELKAALAEKEEKPEEHPETEDQTEKPAETDEEKKTIAEALEAEKEASLVKDATIAEQTTQIAELTEKIAELESYKSELDAIKEAQAQAEKVAKQNRLKAFAEKMRLDPVEDAVATAIAELNYEALVNMASEIKEPTTEQPEIAAIVAGDSLKVKSRFGNLLDRK